MPLPAKREQEEEAAADRQHVTKGQRTRRDDNWSEYLNKELTARYTFELVGREDVAGRANVVGPDVTVFGDGTQTRSFCYVSDLVRGILSLMDANTNEPVNIGNPHEVTIEEIARTIIRLIGASSKIIYRPLPVDDPRQRRPDITAARTLLGWEPTVGLEEGLTKSIEYFKTRVT